MVLYSDKQFEWLDVSAFETDTISQKAKKIKKLTLILMSVSFFFATSFSVSADCSLCCNILTSSSRASFKKDVKYNYNSKPHQKTAIDSVLE